jgi:hypothetical protein
MSQNRMRRVARIDKWEVSDLPAAWSNGERGRYLRGLISSRGVQPGKLFYTEYYPDRSCWLLIQEPQGNDPPSSIPESALADESFFVQAMTQFRRSARAAFAAAAAQSTHFASHGCAYDLPDRPQEATPAELATLLGTAVDDSPAVRFTAEGEWRQTSGN